MSSGIPSNTINIKRKQVQRRFSALLFILLFGLSAWGQQLKIFSGVSTNLFSQRPRIPVGVEYISRDGVAVEVNFGIKAPRWALVDRSFFNYSDYHSAAGAVKYYLRRPRLLVDNVGFQVELMPQNYGIVDNLLTYDQSTRNSYISTVIVSAQDVSLHLSAGRQWTILSWGFIEVFAKAGIRMESIDYTIINESPLVYVFCGTGLSYHPPLRNGIKTYPSINIGLRVGFDLRK